MRSVFSSISSTVQSGGEAGVQPRGDAGGELPPDGGGPDEDGGGLSALTKSSKTLA